LEIFESEDVLNKNKARAQDLANAFAWAKSDTRIEHWRQQGMILAFDIKQDFIKKPATFAREMFAQCINEGLLIRPIGNTIYVMPPYILSTEESSKMGKSVALALDRVLV
jgi:adenosylmethionine-8-amino-7-oxononanoate aminotransferase